MPCHFLYMNNGYCIANEPFPRCEPLKDNEKSNQGHSNFEDSYLGSGACCGYYYHEVIRMNDTVGFHSGLIQSHSSCDDTYLGNGAFSV